MKCNEEYKNASKPAVRRRRTSHGQLSNVRSGVIESVSARPTSVQVPVERVMHSIGFAPNESLKKPATRRASGSMPMRISAHLVLVTALLLGLRHVRAGADAVNEIAMYWAIDPA